MGKHEQGATSQEVREPWAGGPLPLREGFCHQGHWVLGALIATAGGICPHRHGKATLSSGTLSFPLTLGRPGLQKRPRRLRQ